MDLEGTRLRSLPPHNHIFVPWKVKDVIEMLKSGTDAILCLRNCRSQAYRQYFWFRLKKIEKDWTLLESNEMLPLVYSEDELRKLIERMTLSAAEKAM
jgi:hypothetical protein